MGLLYLCAEALVEDYRSENKCTNRVLARGLVHQNASQDFLLVILILIPIFAASRYINVKS